MKKLIILFSFIFLCLPCFAVQEANSYQSLKNAVDVINNHNDDTIEVTGNINFGPSATPLVITTNTILTSTLDSSFTLQGNTTTSPMITFQGSSSTISHINFSSSTAADPAVFINVAPVLTGRPYSTFTIDGVTFSYNTSSTTTGGGALNIVSGQATQIINTTFSTNTANANGGALYYQGDQALIGEKINAYNNKAQLDGGAVYASSITLTGSTFSTNTAVTGNGGAIYVSSGTVSESEFSYNIANVNGGAIYASTVTLTGSVFSTNTATTGNGGAVYVVNGDISDSKFYGNTAQIGGAIYTSTITLKGSTFSGNTATVGDGGALYITNNASIKSTSFKGNTTAGNGGAIYNNEVASIIGGTFDNNQAVKGGAIYNAGLMSISNSSILGNTSTSDGGAIYAAGIVSVSRSNLYNNTSGGNGGAIYVTYPATVTINGSSNLINNTAAGKGGAIYVYNGSLGLNTMGGTITFQGNRDSSGDNDVYLDGSSIMSIESDIDHQGTVNFYGGIKGSGSHIVGMSTNINWYASEGFDGQMNLNGGSLNIMHSNTSGFGNLSLTNSAKLSTQNYTIDNFTPTSLDITGDIPLSIDVDLANNSVDRINNVTGSGRFSINNSQQLRILSDSDNEDVFIVTSGNFLSVNENEVFEGPLYLYNLRQVTGGFRAMQTNRLNPTISALPVAANSKVVANINTVNSLYNRIDVMLSREYLDYYDKLRLQDDINIRMVEEEMARMTGESLGRKREQLVWFIPNGGYQKVDYGNDVEEVKNTFYGGLVGIDYPFWLSNDSAFIPTIFAGYLGARQKYQETTLTNNSFAAGGMLTFRKGFAILSAQAYITNGEESYKYRYNKGYFDVFSATASIKGEFNLNLTDHIVMQPAFTAIYNYSSLQNYTTANLARMYSTRFHNFVLTPSVKLMASLGGWYPYIGASYNFSEKQKGEVIANDLTLTKYKLRSFGELSVGLENTFLKNYSGYVQVSAYTGSSKGVSLQMGLRAYID